MSLISFTPLADGVTGVNAAATNTPLSTIFNDYNGNITDANIASNAAVAFSKISGGSASALTAWTSYVPVWTNVTIGNAVVTARYVQIGKKVVARITVVWGSTTSASSNIVFSLPVTSVAVAGTTNVSTIGYGTMYDVSGALVYDSNVTHLSTTTAGVITKAANGTWVTNSTATNASPVTWANTDEWAWTLIYEAA